jgi:hypothetical protein
MMEQVGQLSSKFINSRDSLGGAGTNSSISFWWYTDTAATAATEEWTGAGPATKTITVS